MREPADNRSSFDRPALLTGSAVFVSGFGVVWLMWTMGEHAPELLGLTSYRSATWGDGLLLPIASASLVYAIRRLPPAHREVLWCSAAAVLATLTGAATQVFWLLDPSPRLNWTIPAPHQMNYAGIYHGLFLTGASALFAVLWVLLLRRIRGLPTNLGLAGRTAVQRAVVLAISCMAAFGWLVVRDNASTEKTNAGLATSGALALGGAALILSLGWTFLRRRPRA
jgi:hypothetical protein